MPMAAKPQPATATRPSQQAGAGAPSDETRVRELTARLAYELYETRGRRAGHADEDWLEAERIVREQLKSKRA